MPIPPNLTPEQKRDFYASLTQEEYYSTLSRCCVGAGVILFNSQGQILVVKPNYREDWLLTGGTIDEGESPAQTAIRETFEEVGITLSVVTFLYVKFEHALRVALEALKNNTPIYGESSR